MVMLTIERKFDGSLFHQSAPEESLIKINGSLYVDCALIIRKYLGKDYRIVDIWQK